MLQSLAERMKLSEDDASKLIHKCMTALGYKAKPSYFADDPGDQGGGGFFGSGKPADQNQGEGFSW